MKLNSFTGGINTRKAPELINSSEAVECLNVDLESDQLVPIKGPGDATISTAPKPWWSRAHKRWYSDGDFIDYQGVVYETDGSIPKKFLTSGASSSNLGIAKPNSSENFNRALPSPDLNLVFRPYELIFKFGVRLGTSYIQAQEKGPVNYRIAIMTGLNVNSKSIYYINQTASFTLSATAVLSVQVGVNTLNMPQGYKLVVARENAGSWSMLRWDTTATLEPGYTAAFVDDASPEFIAPNLPIGRILPFMFGKQNVEVLARVVANDESDVSRPTIRSRIVTEPGAIWASTLESTAIPSHVRLFVDGDWGGEEIPLSSTTPLLGYLGEDGDADQLVTAFVTGTVSYVVTLYDVATGIESPPQEAILDKKSVMGTFIFDVTKSRISDSATHVRLYRLGPESTNFGLVNEVPFNLNGPTTIEDKDSSIPATDALMSNDYYPPKDGLRFLTEVGGVFFGAVGSKIYYSLPGQPDYWPPIQGIDYSIPVTALAKSPQGVLVFTEHETYLLTGFTIGSFTSQLLSADQGCKEHRSIAYLGSTVFFVSNDGICLAQGTRISVASKERFGKLNLDVINATIWDEVCYCQLEGGLILCFDVRYTPRFYYINVGTSWVAEAKDKLHGSIGVRLVEMFEGDPVKWTYKTGDLTEGSSSELKTYTDVYFHMDNLCCLDVEVFINDILVLAKQLESGVKPVQLKIPRRSQEGSTFSLRLSGSGTVKEIEFKAAGRNNGR